MTVDIVSRAMLVAGSLALFAGPMLQALAELRDYRDLVKESRLDEVAKAALSLLVVYVNPIWPIVVSAWNLG